MIKNQPIHTVYIGSRRITGIRNVLRGKRASYAWNDKVMHTFSLGKGWRNS